jgi:hypothetical protein
MSQNSMTYHIYFHRDFDGICSAAVFSTFARLAISASTKFEFVAVDYEMKKTWADQRLPKPSAIVDFLYHPDAEWWFDHHQTTFVRKDWELDYRADERHFWRTAYRSCPRLVIDSIPDTIIRRKLARRFSECLDWFDVIDSASYSSPRQVIECREPALQINSTLSQDTSHQYLDFLIRSLQRFSLRKVAALAEVQTRCAKAKVWQEQAISCIRGVAVVDKHVAFIDLAGHAELFHRYAVYYLWPDLKFQVALYKVGSVYKLTVGANPWGKYEGPDLSALCEKFGGGGHPSVAGVMVVSRRQALRIASEICRVLRKETPFHQQLSFRHAIQVTLQ